MRVWKKPPLEFEHDRNKRMAFENVLLGKLELPACFNYSNCKFDYPRCFCSSSSFGFQVPRFGTGASPGYLCFLIRAGHYPFE